ncbi:type I secretion system permease/ATPase [Futiania mangrovi]|uniref:Type I secretion system permease/ATPase n=1 Tax=Futiania mangrovi TaxID=2959716 RepID=A0A9J6P8D4_9PROT|nr:type I secretion system permease/ATPase [Futiania mangrovii]MCP1335908.1 type I secretion system permease/ATPase [Futiania mangrovii]
MTRKTGDAGEGFKALRSAFLATAGFSMVINLLMLVSPVYMMQVYDRVLTSQSGETLVALTAVAVGLLVIYGVLEGVRGRMLIRIGNAFDERIRRPVFNALALRALTAGAGGRLAGLRDVDTVRQFLTGAGPAAFFDAPWIPVYLLVIFLIHPVLGGIAVAGAVLLIGMALATEWISRTRLREAGQHLGEAEQFADQTVRNIEALRAMGMTGRARTRWLGRWYRGLSLQSEAADWVAVLQGLSKALRIVLQVGVLAGGASLVLVHEMSAGMMIAASIIVGRAVAPVEQMIGSWRGFVGARGAYDRLKELLAAFPEPGKRMRLPRPEGQVTVENAAAVAPGGREPILRGISFAMEPGEVMAVIGPSASGKSTLARLLVGVWPAAAGAVRLGGADVFRWAHGDLGRYVGYVPQDVELFDATVKENIARLGDIDPQKVVDAARLAGVHELILSLPDGYETRIGEGGRALSGGQRQRIALARALYDNPAFVVLDEPNANLDHDGDLALLKCIAELKRRGITVVLISHRPSMLQGVDRILVLRDGMVSALGPRDEILNRTAQPLPFFKPSHQITTQPGDDQAGDEASAANDPHGGGGAPGAGGGAANQAATDDHDAAAREAPGRARRVLEHFKEAVNG